MIANDALVAKLAQAVLDAQASEADAVTARTAAENALAELRQEVELSPETEALVAKALGNAVAAAPVDGAPVSAPTTDAPAEPAQ